MVASHDEIKSRYEKAGQEHVLKYYHDLSSDEQTNLLGELNDIKVEGLSQLLSAATVTAANDHDDVEGIPKIEPFNGPVGYSTDQSLVDSSHQKGIEAIQRGEVAALVLAGGQGTRLGFDGPKGMYDIGLPSHSTLFQSIVQRLMKLCSLAQQQQAASTLGGDKDISIPLYVMTSPLNHDTTVQYFQKQNYFGYRPGDIIFFRQGMLPCLSDEGKIIMESPSKVAMAPDGNGGIYPSLQNSGSIKDMKNRGVQYLHVFSIDNSLIKPADPVFMGYCIQNAALCGNKSVWKTNPHEKVGIVVSKKGKPTIIEYSEMTPEMAELREDSNNDAANKEGKLQFGAGNICNHFYTMEFICDHILPNLGNMYHIAHKKIPYYDESTKTPRKKPTSNNGIKLESFIFDVFPLVPSIDQFCVFEILRSEEFAPVKNATGTDSPESARLAISELSKQWVQAAGGTLVNNSATAICEVSPLTSYNGEDLQSLVKDKEIECPFSL